MPVTWLVGTPCEAQMRCTLPAGGSELGSENAEVPSRSWDFQRRAARSCQCHVEGSDRHVVRPLGGVGLFSYGDL
jgi:hypothetical protein